MGRLTLDDVQHLLPDLDELRPVLDHLLACSVPDDTRRWAGSGDLETSGARLVDRESLDGAAKRLAEHEHAQASKLFSIVITALQLLGDDDASGAARSLLEAADLEEERDRPSRAAGYADAAYETALGAGDFATAGVALRRRARARRGVGDLRQAERDYAKAHEVAQAISDHRGSAEAAIGAGNVLEEQGRWKEAEEWYGTALRTLEEEGLETAERWHALLNLHVVMRSSGSLEQSLEPLREAEMVAARLDDQGGRQFFENAHGQLQMARGDFAAAEAHLRAALQASSSPRASVTIRLNLSESLLAVGRGLEAAEEARRAEREALTGHLPHKLPEVYRILGRIAAAERNPDAFVLFERALEIVRSRRLPDLEAAITLQAYAEAQAGLGDLDSSEGLKARADDLFQRLGLSYRRLQWSDRFVSDRPDDGPFTDA